MKKVLIKKIPIDIKALLSKYNYKDYVENS